MTTPHPSHKMCETDGQFDSRCDYCDSKDPSVLTEPCKGDAAEVQRLRQVMRDVANKLEREWPNRLASYINTLRNP